MALASADGANYLYVANFHAGTVEVYDGTYAAHSFGSDAFVDCSIPSGYAPFNVQLIPGNKLVVTYAKQDAAKHDDVPGPGNGYVDVYDTQGNLAVPPGSQPVPEFALGSGGWRPRLPGFAGDLLIGNFGSGLITALQRQHGRLDRQHVEREQSACADRRPVGL